MPHGGPIPAVNSQFNAYLLYAIPYLAAEQARLLIAAENITALHDYLNQWKTLYRITTDKSLRTQTAGDDQNDLKKKISQLLRAVYADIPRSRLNNTDRTTLNLKQRKARSKKPAIDGVPWVSVITLGGSWFKVIFRRLEDSDRPSLHRHADEVELRYKIDGTEPVTPEDCPKNITSTRAVFILKPDPADAGKRIFGFGRWKNSRQPEKSSAWSAMFTRIIGG